MRTKLSATNAYIIPTSNPLMSNSRKNSISTLLKRASRACPHPSYVSGSRFGHVHLVDRLDSQDVFDLGLPAILVGDDRLDLDLGPLIVEGCDDILILLGDIAASDLAGARHLLIIGIQLLVKQHVYPYARRGG